MQSFGATVGRDRTGFRVWAPLARRVQLQLVGGSECEMRREADGTFAAEAPARAGDRYFYQVDGHKPVPDPVSRLLPEGVHGPTAIVDPDAFRWSDREWRGPGLRDYVIYELHIGTFTPSGTFDAAVERLAELQRLGITVIELMPVAAFPGERNWGYDGVSLYAVQASYGGPEGLKRFVDAAHRLGLAVLLDVVYNHLGNEGNYLRMFGPYFTARHTTPWGEAVNYDGPGSAGVRRFVLENAAYWVREYHLDGLRLDAVQTITDDSPRHILAEIGESVHGLARELGRKVLVIAESDENDARLVRPRERGGYGLDAVWSDDFHHALHAYFTAERKGYYQDFGPPAQIVRALNQGFAFQGEPFAFWQGRPRGTASAEMRAEQHVICLQNHDQVGNRARGERLSALVPLGARKLMAALLLLAPQTPLLFMGEEYDENNPFQFFTSYGDPALRKAVAEGRRNDFKDFTWDEVPDPEDPATFARSKLSWQPADPMSEWYRRLLELRRQYVTHGERTCQAELRGDVLVMQVPRAKPRITVQAVLQAGAVLPAPAGRVLLESQEGGFGVRVQSSTGH